MTAFNEKNHLVSQGFLHVVFWESISGISWIESSKIDSPNPIIFLPTEVTFCQFCNIPFSIYINYNLLWNENTQGSMRRQGSLGNILENSFLLSLSHSHPSIYILSIYLYMLLHTEKHLFQYVFTQYTAGTKLFQNNLYSCTGNRSYIIYFISMLLLSNSLETLFRF